MPKVDAAAVSSSSDNTSADWKAGAKGAIETKEAQKPPEMIDAMTQTQLEYQATDLPTPAKYSSPFVAVRRDKFAELWLASIKIEKTRTAKRVNTPYRSVNRSTQIGSRPQRRRKTYQRRRYRRPVGEIQRCGKLTFEFSESRPANGQRCNGDRFRQHGREGRVRVEIRCAGRQGRVPSDGGIPARKALQGGGFEGQKPAFMHRWSDGLAAELSR